MAERKKGFTLKFWKKKQKELPEVELTRKPGVLDLHRMLLAEQGSACAVRTEDLDVPVEEHLKDSTASPTPTRLGEINTTNPIVEEGVTNIFMFLMDEMLEMEFMGSTFKSIMDLVGRDALLEIQVLLTKQVELIIADGVSTDTIEIFSQRDIECIMAKLQVHLSRSMEETRVLAYALAFKECVKRVNGIKIDVQKNEADEDDYSHASYSRGGDQEGNGAAGGMHK